MSVSLVSVSFLSSLLVHDYLSCSELVGDLDLVGFNVFFTAFEKINLGFGFSLRSFLITCSLGMRSFVWFWMISVSIPSFGQFPERAR